MDSFYISNIYDRNGMKIIDINPLPHKICSFDCVYCPLGKSVLKSDKQFYFDETAVFIERLSSILDINKIDMVFINPNGEAMSNAQLIDIVKLIKDHGIKIKLLTNGYVLNKPENKKVLELCDEVIGEFSVTKEKEFQIINRPIKGYSLIRYVKNMMEFKQWFKGKFILDITLLKGYADSEEAINKIKEAIEIIKPDEVAFGTPDKDEFKGAFYLNDKVLGEIRDRLIC